MTAPQEEWTEWFEHDGKGCPDVVKSGMQIEAIDRGGEYYQGAVFEWVRERPNWIWPKSWCLDHHRDIIRFRIRKPRALLELIQLIADLPAPVAPIKTDGVIA